MQTEGKSTVLIRTRKEFMAEGERLLDLGVISIRDLHALESKRNIKLAKQKEEQQRAWRTKAKKARKENAKKLREETAEKAKAGTSIRPKVPVEVAPQASTSVDLKSTKVSVSSTAAALVNTQSAYAPVSMRPPQQHGYQSMYMYQPNTMPQQMSFAAPQMNSRSPIGPLQANVQTNVVPQQSRFPAKPKALPKIPTPNFNKRYVGTVTKLKGNVYCQGLVGEVQLDGKTIYEYCLKEGDGIEFKVKKSRHGRQNFYMAEDIELL